MVSRRVCLKTTEQIGLMRAAGQVVASALRDATDACRPGVTTRDIDCLVSEVIDAHGAEGLFKGYSRGQETPFPASACISVNDEVVHGVPGDRVLQPGDLVSIDVGVRLPSGSSGWCADAARSLVVPTMGRELPADRWWGIDDAERLIQATRESVELARSLMRPGLAWSKVTHALQEFADEAGFGVVAEYVGHGVGRQLHEEPKAPASPIGSSCSDFILEVGMVLAVEPILTLSRDHPRTGPTDTSVMDDGWTVRTDDGSLACHEEHTIAVTKEGAEALTRIQD